MMLTAEMRDCQKQLAGSGWQDWGEGYYSLVGSAEGPGARGPLTLIAYVAVPDRSPTCRAALRRAPRGRSLLVRMPTRSPELPNVRRWQRLRLEL